MIDNMNKINQNMDKYKNNNRKIKFIVNIDEILRLIKALGNINSDGNKIYLLLMQILKINQLYFVM